MLAEVKKLAEDGHADAKEGLAFMTDEMLSRGKSLSAWVDTSAESYRDGITAGNLEAHYKANTKDTILNYEAYVQDLVTKANIKYHK